MFDTTLGLFSYEICVYLFVAIFFGVHNFIKNVFYAFIIFEMLVVIVDIIHIYRNKLFN